MITSVKSGSQEELYEQIDRIVKSETFRNSDALQRLLRYLGEKVAAGEADQLKEYTIGVEGMGRPSTYNPAHDASTRMQIGRLRQKLAIYYSDEGKNDPFLITLPKGSFKLSLDTVSQAPTSETPASPAIDMTPSPSALTSPRPVRTSGNHTALLYAAIFLLATWAVAATTRLVFDHRRLPNAVDDLTPALRELWQPFLESDRPLFIGIGDPVFVEFKDWVFLRLPGQTDWRDPQNAARIAAIQKALDLGSSDIQITHRYAGIGEVNSAFMLGKFLAPWFPHISLIRSSELSWQELSGTNLLFIGGASDFRARLKNMPTELDVTYEDHGIRVRTPNPGEPDFLPDVSPHGSYEEGENFALITHVPGPDGEGDIEAFTSKSSAAAVGAVQWYSSPEHAAYLVTKLRNKRGAIPRYYQLVLRVRFKGGVPIETSYVLHRELRIAPLSAKQ
jgi:hypothetical protein